MSVKKYQQIHLLIFWACFNDLSSLRMNNFKGKICQVIVSLSSCESSYDQFSWSKKNFFLEKNLGGTETRTKKKSQERIIYEGAAYLQFTLQWRRKVDKLPRLSPGGGKGQMDALGPCVSSNISHQKKDFPGQIIIAKFISGETAI